MYYKQIQALERMSTLEAKRKRAKGEPAPRLTTAMQHAGIPEVMIPCHVAFMCVMNAMNATNAMNAMNVMNAMNEPCGIHVCSLQEFGYDTSHVQMSYIVWQYHACK